MKTVIPVLMVRGASGIMEFVVMATWVGKKPSSCDLRSVIFPEDSTAGVHSFSRPADNKSMVT